MAGVENPWSAEFWNLTQQGAYIKKYGEQVAMTKAKQAGARLGDLQPRVSPTFTRNFILIKKVPGDVAPQGTSGNGPPTS